jgi:pimeloyl-CoA synthetase
MKRKLTFATGMAVGYVAGTHAGRQRYEQMKQKAHELSRQPTMVDARENLRDHASTATKTVAAKVTEVASELTHKLHASGDGESGPLPR